jgi:hypothetical protein
MAKLLIDYDKNSKLECTFQDNSLQDDIILLESILKIADNISLEILKQDKSLGEDIDKTMVNICNTFLKASQVYEANKKILNSPSPAVHPLLSFIKFRK